MIAIKFVTKTAVSLILSLPLALTKCSAQPIGMNTNKTFLYISQHVQVMYKLTYNQLERAAALKLPNNVGAFPIFLSGVNNPVVIRLIIAGIGSLLLVRPESPDPCLEG